jgi:hypothetical protein
VEAEAVQRLGEVLADAAQEDDDAELRNGHLDLACHWPSGRLLLTGYPTPIPLPESQFGTIEINSIDQTVEIGRDRLDRADRKIEVGLSDEVSAGQGSAMIEAAHATGGIASASPHFGGP